MADLFLSYASQDQALAAAANDSPYVKNELNHAFAAKKPILGGGTDVNGGTEYDIARDGRILINTVLDQDAASPITLLQNWNPEAKE